MNKLQQLLFNKDACEGSISYRGKGDLVIQGKLKNVSAMSKLFFWAAAPPTYGTSFSGSGMPYNDPLTAYDRTPNKGVIDVQNGNFTINMKYPNAYYIGLGSVYIPPHINFKVSDTGKDDTYFTVQIDPRSHHPRRHPYALALAATPTTRAMQASACASSSGATSHRPRTLSSRATTR